jgi:hypothetical protein
MLYDSLKFISVLREKYRRGIFVKRVLKGMFGTMQEV